MMIDHLGEGVELLAMVKPDVIVIAHTATSYHLGREAEGAVLARLQEASGARVVTAFGCVLEALRRLDIKRLALGAPYAREVTLQGKAHLETHGFDVVNFANLPGVTNIYELTAEHAYKLGRSIDAETAEAVFLTGTGMPTVPILQALEHELGKPVISSASATMWHALRSSGVGEPIEGYGRLLRLH
jgi:maleate cis-trans isomerase